MHGDLMTDSEMQKIETSVRGLKWTFMAAGSAALIMSFTAPDASAMTLEEALKLAVDSHPLILVEKSGLEQAGHEIDEA